MTYRGQIHDGAVVLDERVSLPEGSMIECVLISLDPLKQIGPEKAAGLYDDLLPFAGIIKGTPPDASENLDHYLYGHPKK